MASDDDFIAEDVARVGWSCLTIRDAEPPFAYTVGLMHSYQHPELIIFGRPEDGSAILNDLALSIQQGSRIDTDEEYGILDGFPIATRRVHESQHELYLGFAMGYLTSIGRIGELQAVQVFVPDIYGVYPFQPNCALQVWQSQPRLDIPLTKSELKKWRSQW